MWYRGYNIFINKDEESKIIICKTIKYTILSSENTIKIYCEEFKYRFT